MYNSATSGIGTSLTNGMTIPVDKEFLQRMGCGPTGETPQVIVKDCGARGNECGPRSILAALYGDDVLMHDDIDIFTAQLRLIAGSVFGCDNLQLQYQCVQAEEEAGPSEAPKWVFEQRQLTRASRGPSSFVPEIFFMALGQVFGFGVVIYEPRTQHWSHYNPPETPLLPCDHYSLSNAPWLAFAHVNSNHWVRLCPTKPIQKWAVVSIFMEVESQDIEEHLQSALRIAIDNSLQIERDRLPTTRRWLLSLQKDASSRYGRLLAEFDAIGDDLQEDAITLESSSEDGSGRFIDGLDMESDFDLWYNWYSDDDFDEDEDGRSSSYDSTEGN